MKDSVTSLTSAQIIDGKAVENLVAEGLLSATPGRLTATEQGRMVLNAVTGALLT